jgi:PadR family transcriptional regulator, regulatory protein PadR
MGQLGEFEQMVLFSVLRLGDEAYGLAIRDVIKDQTGRTVSSGAIYTTLGRLEERRLIGSRVGSPVPGRSGRPRKFYTLTPSGAKALMGAYRTTQKLADGLLPILAELAEG